MPRRGDLFHPGYYYHIYNRGAGRQPIFFGEPNYEYCLRLMKRYSRRYEVAIIAYCLMPNHYHLLLRQNTDLPLSRFISALFNAYVQAVNKQKNRSGTLFEGRFRHVVVEDESYVTHLCRYIHMNPVKANLVKAPEDWPYSNYLEWIEQRSGTLKEESFIKERFPSPTDYQAFVADWHQESERREELSAYIGLK